MTIILFIAAWVACGVAAGVWFYTNGIQTGDNHDYCKKGANALLIGGVFSLILIVLIIIETYFEQNWLWPWSEKAKKEAGL